MAAACRRRNALFGTMTRKFFLASMFVVIVLSSMGCQGFPITATTRRVLSSNAKNHPLYRGNIKAPALSCRSVSSKQMLYQEKRRRPRIPPSSVLFRTRRSESNASRSLLGLTPSPQFSNDSKIPINNQNNNPLSRRIKSLVLSLLFWKNQKLFGLFCLCNVRKRFLSLCVSLFLVFSLHVGTMPAFAKSGYRTGGSFKSVGGIHSQQRSNTYSRPLPHTSHHHSHHHHPHQQHHQRHPPPPPPSGIGIMQALPIVTSAAPWVSVSVNAPPVRDAVYIRRAEPMASRFSAGDVLVLTGTGALLTYGFVKQRNRFNDNFWDGTDEMNSALGPGATAISVTVALNVLDRDNPRSILNRLERLAESVDTSTREGVQQLIAETSMELLREEESITSMEIKSKHHSNSESARKDFNAQSVENRRKYEREAVDRYGGKHMSSSYNDDDDDAASSSSFQRTSTTTVAIVNVNLAINGDSTHVGNSNQLKTRADLIETLQRIASDAPVEDCLFAGEVIWIPGDRRDSLTRDDVYERHPNLLLV